MKTIHLLTLIVSTAVSTSLVADVVIHYDGDNNNYGTGTLNLNDTAGSGYSTSSIAPSSGYTGPAFYGGTELVGTTLPTYAVSDTLNWTGETLGNDLIAWSVNGVDANDTVFGTFVFDSSVDFQLDSSSQFYINSRRQGGRDLGGTTPGLRWVLRDATSGDLYISELLNQNFAAGYEETADIFTTSTTSTYTEADPETLNWFNYAPAGTDISTIGSSASIDFNSATFDQAGFWYANTRNVSGGLAMGFGQFAVDAVAIPEPSTFALVGLTGLAALFAARRRR